MHTIVLLVVAIITPVVAAAVVVAIKTMETCWHSLLAVTKGKNAGAKQDTKQVSRAAGTHTQSSQKPKQIKSFTLPVARCTLTT